jgi:CheY-like chemotaxis protein
VLLVEDNRDAAETLAELMRLWGSEVEVAHEANAALKAVPHFRPDIVLLDLGLPGIDGYELARRIRSSGHLNEAVLVALTGYSDSHHRLHAVEAGFQHYLTKPVAPEALRRLVSGPTS